MPPAGDAAALLLERRWSKIMAVLVAVGAMSGTNLSYEMGLLWPGLMGRFRAGVGWPFSLAGIFFFLEARSSGNSFGLRHVLPAVRVRETMIVPLSPELSDQARFWGQPCRCRVRRMRFQLFRAVPSSG